MVSSGGADSLLGQAAPGDDESEPKLIGIAVKKPPGDKPATQPSLPLAAELERAAGLQSQKKWEQALEILNGILAREDEDPATAALALHRKGECLLWMGEPKKALEELKELEVRYPGETGAIQQARVVMIDAYNFLGQPREAEEIARSALAAHANGQGTDVACAWARIKLSGLLRGRGALDEALDVLRGVDALDLPADDPTPRIHAGVAMGEILQARGHQYEAIPVLENVVATGKTDDPHAANWARVHLMDIFAQKFQDARALELFDDIMADHAAAKADNRQLAWALLFKGRVLIRSGKLQEASASLQTVVALLQRTPAGKDRDIPYAHPEIACSAMTALGDVTELQACSASDKSVSASLRQQALEHYRDAFKIARRYGVGDPDKIRQQMGDQMLRLGQRKQAVAWWRMGIEDPANMSPQDLQLARRITDTLSADRAEAWRQYLIAPAGMPDPTEELVQSELEVGAPQPGSDTVNRLFDRYYWLGRLYQEQRRFSDAVAAFRNAHKHGKTDRESGEALAALAFCLRRTEGPQAAGQAAEQAVQHWLRVLDRATSDAEAHRAIDMAAVSYARAGLGDEALAVLKKLKADLSPERHPARACFARYLLVQQYQSRQRDADAKKLTKETLDMFLEKPFEQGHGTICGNLLLSLVTIHVREGDFSRAEAVLDELTRRWPVEFADRIASYRTFIDKKRAESANKDQEKE